MADEMFYIPLVDPETERVWRIKKHPVFRLVDNKQWLDNFFANGEILLSCFCKFREYPDEFQGDPTEGEALAYFVLNNGGTVGLKYQTGYNAYVMSTTVAYDDKIIKDFNAIGAIKINNVTGFALEIANALNNFETGLEGNCIYTDSRVYFIKDEYLSMLYNGKEAVYQREFQQQFQLATAEREIFMKHNKYKYQQEYRLAWIVNEAVNSSLILKCPALIEMCERIDF